MQNGFDWQGALSDAELIARVLTKDDRHAFAELVRRYQSDVRSLCRRLTSDPSTADDLAQDAFLHAYRGLRRYRGGAKFSTWLYRIAYNLFLSEQRRGKGLLARWTTGSAEPSDLGTLPERSDQKHDLERALGALSPEERAALVLTYGRDVSHEEAATILDCPLGTLKTHVARAKVKLRRLLSDAEVSADHGRANG